MKHFISTMAVAGMLAIAAPAAAQDDGGDVSEGLGLLGEGTRLILEGLMEEMRPMLEEARPYFEEEVLPFLDRMGELMDDFTSYELPERLPNGDIIIRRSPDAPEFQPGVTGEGDVEL
ncbi:AAA+ family ATPase [Hasllibacter sp. MH4015]|uniref:AAA+ family ATPase n=1 Tax=Hasllibacter sp. MH4015 TaxID=2854029 RepID=UPI001CD504DD|nr:AAA+ family ATPase [Hasllibacter sp. MH4015]